MTVEAQPERPSPRGALGRRRRPSATSIIGVLFLALIVVWLLRNLISDPELFIEISLIGLTTGCVYALVALGYTLVYGILQLINFAHGDVFALSGLVAYSISINLLNLTGNTATIALIGGLALTLVLAAAFAASLNFTIEFLAYRRLRDQPRLTMLITAVGMSFIVSNIALYFYGVRFYSASDLIQAGGFTIGEISVRWNQLVVILITIPVLLILTWLVKSTKQGKGMRAVAQDQDAAAMMGINVNRTISFTFILAGSLAGAAGLLFVLLYNMRYNTGFELGLIAFTAAVLGGIGNLAGAALGGILIGLIQSWNEGLTHWTAGGSWTRSIVFAILIAILVFRPEGLLGERTPEGA
ncbi:MAG TPA: branched-chain amino acid ABC transporter permease [Gaiellaceae bacterium]|nr:branched-chain amino acid ABC transporter permease [Gaiellaceae bacterium]